MAATENREGLTIEITAIDADWDWDAQYPDETNRGAKIASIQFNPAGADTLIIKEGSASGPVIFNAACASATDQKIKYYHGARKIPYIDFSDCSLTANHSVIIELWPGKR